VIAKEKAQPADKDNSKVPAKRSRRSQEKAQPADEDNSKVPAKKVAKVWKKLSQRTRRIAKCPQREVAGTRHVELRMMHSQWTGTIPNCL